MRDEQCDADRHEEGNQQCQGGDQYGTEQQRSDVAPEAGSLAAGEVADGRAVGLLVTADQRPRAEQQEQRDRGEHDEDQDAAGVGHALEHLIRVLAAHRLLCRFALRTHGFSFWFACDCFRFFWFCVSSVGIVSGRSRFLRGCGLKPTVSHRSPKAIAPL